MTLQRSDWIDAGWLLMATKGVEAVKVEVLARELKVSKGSFYWHFANRRELLNAILQRWEEETQFFIKQSQQAATPQERLNKLFKLIEECCHKSDPESAILLWANKDAEVRQRVRDIENKRLNYLTKLLQDCGFEETEARHRAEVTYFALGGFFDRRERDSEFDLSMGEFGQFLLALLLSPIKKSY